MAQGRKSPRLTTLKLAVLLIVPVLLLGAIPGGALAVRPATDGTPFQTITLPPSAWSVSALPASLRPGKSHAKLDSALAELSSAASVGADEALSLAQSRLLRLDGDRVQVQVVTSAAGLNAAVKAIRAAGGEVTGVADGNTRIQAWVPVGQLAAVAAQPDIYRVRPPAEVFTEENLAVGASTTQGVNAMNAQTWQAAGFRGAGVKIGIIDAGFTGYPTLLGSDLPASVTVKNFVDGENDSQVNGSTQHGTACAEIIHDVAPDATLYLAKIATDVDLAEAVAWLKDVQHVKIISTSLGWYNLTPGDGTGEFANLVNQARAAGILWATAASNDREAHWGGAFNDPDGDKIHNFNGTQNIDYFGPGDGTAYLIPAGYAFRVFLRWDDWASVNQDYDLYLLRWNGSSWTEVASSVDFQNGGAGQTPTEFAAVATSGSSAPYGFYIERYSSNRNVNMEIFAPKVARLDELTHARSLSNLADAPNAVTVAALDVTSPYPQESYSSEGPTNGPGGTAAGGAIKPDISGFANVSTQSYGAGGFNGTSSATPHVAGAAALVWSAYPSYIASQVQSVLEGRAIDMGAVGKDTVFGSGRLYLGSALLMNRRTFLPVMGKGATVPIAAADGR